MQSLAPRSPALIERVSAKDVVIDLADRAGVQRVGLMTKDQNWLENNSFSARRFSVPAVNGSYFGNASI